MEALYEGDARTNESINEQPSRDSKVNKEDGAKLKHNNHYKIKPHEYKFVEGDGMMMMMNLLVREFKGVGGKIITLRV